MLFAVIIGPSASDRTDLQWSVEERRQFLDALKATRQLVLEATYGDNGSLLVLHADSTQDALALLHNDPYVLACGRVQIRPLIVNFVGALEATSDRARRDDREGAEAMRRPSRKRSAVTVLASRKGGGSS